MVSESYNEALQKLYRLRDEDHVFTLESGQSESEAERKMHNSLKRKKLMDKAELVKQAMNVPISTYKPMAMKIPKGIY